MGNVVYTRWPTTIRLIRIFSYCAWLINIWQANEDINRQFKTNHFDCKFSRYEHTLVGPTTESQVNSINRSINHNFESGLSSRATLKPQLMLIKK